jgi:hypothetical protein
MTNIVKDRKSVYNAEVLSKINEHPHSSSDNDDFVEISHNFKLVEPHEDNQQVDLISMVKLKDHHTDYSINLKQNIVNPTLTATDDSVTAQNCFKATTRTDINTKGVSYSGTPFNTMKKKDERLQLQDDDLDAVLGNDCTTADVIAAIEKTSHNKPVKTGSEPKSDANSIIVESSTASLNSSKLLIHYANLS